MGELRLREKVRPTAANINLTKPQLLNREGGQLARRAATNISAKATPLHNKTVKYKQHILHIDLLMPYKETEAYGKPFTRPPPVIEGEEEYEIEAILAARRHGRRCKLQYLMHWKHYPNSDNSWIDHSDLNAPELLKEYYSTSASAG